MRPLEKGSPEAIAWGVRMRAIRKRVRRAGKKLEKKFFRKGKLKPYGGMEPNPGAAWHEEEEKQARKARRAAREVPEKTFYSGVESAHRISAHTARRMGMNPRRRKIKRNPIALYGNPKNSVHAKYAGILYNQVIEIRARKTQFKKGFYKHPFERGVQLIALENGDLLIHSTRGKTLWTRT